MGSWSDEERQREHDRQVAYNLGAQSRDAEIARLKAEVVNQRHEIGMLLTDLAAHKRALAAGPAALRDKACPRNDCGDCEAWRRASDVVEAAQAKVMKEGT